MQGDVSNPSPGFRARHVLGGVLLLALVGMLAREWGLRRNEPRYLGRTEREWFPLSSQGALPAVQLTAAPPEALPMLIAALHRPDSRLVDWWNGIADRAPDIRGVEFHVIAPTQVRYFAIQAMIQSASRPDFARALTERFDGLTEDDQFGILHELGNLPTPRESIHQLSPVLVRCLEKRQRFHARLAGLALFKEPALARRHVAQLVSIVTEKRMRDSVFVPIFLNRLGDLGSVDAQDVQPLVQAVQALSTNATHDVLARRNRIFGLIALSRLDPVQFPPAGFLGGASDQADRNARVELLGQLLVEKVRESLLPTDLAVWIEQFLGFDGFDRLDASPIERGAHQGQALEILNRLSRMTRVSPELQDTVLGGMKSPSPSVRRATAVALAQIRHPTPKVVDRAAALLLDGWEPDLMVRVLSNARMIPNSARGLVDSLESGDMRWFLPTLDGPSADRLNLDLGFAAAPPDWTPKPTLSDESARRIGLPHIRDSLPPLAKELLRRVEENAGSGMQK